MIQHIAININEIKDADEFFCKLKEIITKCFEKQIPVLTLNIPEMEFDELDKLMTIMLSWETIDLSQIKINIFGKWFNLPGRIVDDIKKLINETKDYDRFFLNFCIKYDGQEEIVDACKLISRRVQLDKISSENITKTDFKENLYTSAFMPPELIINFGKKLKNFLLWDSGNAIIKFCDQKFQDVEFEEMIE